MPADVKSGLHFCFVGADAQERRRLPCRGADKRRARQRQARPARRLRPRLLCRLRRSIPTATGSRPIAGAPRLDQDAAMTTTLHDASGSPYAWRVWLALEPRCGSRRDRRRAPTRACPTSSRRCPSTPATSRRRRSWPSIRATACRCSSTTALRSTNWRRSSSTSRTAGRTLPRVFGRPPRQRAASAA